MVVLSVPNNHTRNHFTLDHLAHALQLVADMAHICHSTQNDIPLTIFLTIWTALTKLEIIGLNHLTTVLTLGHGCQYRGIAHSC
jgi:hypothetical protein